MASTAKATVSTETFDEFLESENLLAPCEESAIEEVVADRIRAAMEGAD